jgi:purine-nucleoside phosphorylase
MDNLEKQLLEAEKFIRKTIARPPKLAIILGSGLGAFADGIKNPQNIPTSKIPNYPISTVEGHAGFWVHGKTHNKNVLAVKGRVHFYEGYSLEKVTFSVRLLAKLGIKYLLITNAAGSLNPMIRPGDLMLIDDHINLFFKNPLIGQNTKSAAERFIDMSKPYDPNLIKLAKQTALDLKIELKSGILVSSTGPTYETAAEVKMMQKLGGDAGTMSTVPEVIVANQCGMKVLGISCITNLATGLSQKKLDHQEVTETAGIVADKFQNLVAEIINRILQPQRHRERRVEDQ